MTRPMKYTTANKSTKVLESQVKLSVAMGYIPCLLTQLDADGREMLGQVMQAFLDIGHEEAYADCGRFEKEDR